MKIPSHIIKYALKENKAVKKNRGMKGIRHTQNQKKNGNINQNILLITLNMNGLSDSFKRHRLPDWIK